MTGLDCLQRPPQNAEYIINSVLHTQIQVPTEDPNGQPIMRTSREETQICVFQRGDSNSGARSGGDWGALLHLRRRSSSNPDLNPPRTHATPSSNSSRCGSGGDGRESRGRAISGSDARTAPPQKCSSKPDKHLILIGTGGPPLLPHQRQRR